MKIMVMGVSGAGKSAVGAALAQALNLPFVDADDLHPETNRAKMAAGSPLSDEDRWPWLDRVALALQNDGVIACSALKSAYRAHLRANITGHLQIIHLTGSAEVIAQRLAVRQGHFMPANLLYSQISTLEPPRGDEAIIIDLDQPIAEIVRQIVVRLRGEPA